MTRTRRIALIVTLLALAGIAAAAPEAGAIDERRFVEDVTAFVEARADSGLFSGTVLVAKDGEPVFQAAHGYANLDYSVQNSIDTKFNLGSMNKMFTAVAIAQLAEQGKLSFDDTIAKHLPEYPNKEIAGKVTIHQLLTHTSGMGSYWTEEYEKTSKDRFRAVSDYLPLFAEQPLLFEPGSRWSYSNSGFMVLGLIVEAVSGQSYFDYVREHVYKPAGMTDTDAYELDGVVPNHAVGYTRDPEAPGRIKNNLFLHVVKGGPAGGGYSTVRDLLAFSNALTGHRLLGAQMTERVTQRKAETGRAGSGYAYGFQDVVENGHRIIGHSGGFPGIVSFLDIYTDLGYTVAVMSNRDMGADAVREYIQVLLVGKTRAIRDREFTTAILEEIAARGYDAGLAAYERRKSEGTFLEGRANQFGYALLAQKKAAQAIDVFRFNAMLHPQSANVYDSLGEAYMTAGRVDLAIENYGKSVALDPANKHGAEMLERLRAESRR